MRRITVHAITGGGVSILAVLLVVAGLSGSPSQTTAATAGPATAASPAASATNLAAVVEEAARSDRTTSRNKERAEQAVANEAKAAFVERDLILVAQGRAIETRAAKIAKHRAELRKKRAAAEAKRRAAIKKQGYLPGTTDPRDIARQILKNKYGFGADQYSCFNNIIMRESMWKINATNASSGAYGIPQALPGSKMATVAADWRTNPATQIIWGITYMKDRYGSPCGAWGFKSSHGWY